MVGFIPRKSFDGAAKMSDWSALTMLISAIANNIVDRDRVSKKIALISFMTKVFIIRGRRRY